MGKMATASSDSNMILWNIHDLTPVSIHEDHKESIYSLEYYADEQLILSAGRDHDVKIWNPIVKESIFFLKGHNHHLVGVKWLKGTN